MLNGLVSPRTRIFALHLIVFAILLGRRPDAVFRAQFWAEDGAVFFVDQLREGFWHAVATPYSGYLHVVPRILAAAFSGLKIQTLPAAYGISSITIAAFCCGAFSWPRFRCLISSDLVRALCCLLMAALPTGSELIGSITNLQWFLAPVAILLAFSTPEAGQRKPEALAIVALLVLIALSTPGLFVVLPLFLWQLAVKRGWARWNSLALVLGLGVEMLEVLHTKAGGGKQHWNFDSVLISTVASGTAKCVLTPVLGGAFLLQESAKSFVASMLLALLTGLTLLCLFCMTLPAWRQRLIVLSAAYIGVASLAVVMGGRNFAEAFLVPKDIPHIQGERYYFLGCCVFIFLAAFAADFFMARITHPLLNKFPALALLLLFSFGSVRNFHTPPLVDLSWPAYASEIEKWNQLQRNKQPVTPLHIPLNPPPVSMTLQPRN